MIQEVQPESHSDDDVWWSTTVGKLAQFQQVNNLVYFAVLCNGKMLTVYHSELHSSHGLRWPRPKWWKNAWKKSFKKEKCHNVCEAKNWTCIVCGTDKHIKKQQGGIGLDHWHIWHFLSFLSIIFDFEMFEMCMCVGMCTWDIEKRYHALGLQPRALCNVFKFLVLSNVWKLKIFNICKLTNCLNTILASF